MPGSLSRLVFCLGIAAVPAGELERLGWRVSGSGRVVLARWKGGSPMVEIRPDTPFLSWGGDGVHLSEAPYIDGGQTYVPLQFFIDILRARGKDTVLDVATGTGFHSVRLTDAGFNVTSADGSAAMLAKAFENGPEREEDPSLSPTLTLSLPLPPEPAAAARAATQRLGCSSRQVMARTWSKRSRAARARPTSTAPAPARSRRWVSTSLAEA